MTRLLPLLLTGCLVGTDHLKGIPSTPTLDGEVVLLTPEPGPDGAFGREGDTVEIGFSTLAAIDPEASIVTLDGFPMDFAGSDGFTYRYQRTLDGSEGSSPKTVTGTLRNAAERQGALGSPVLLETDFIPPTGSCVLNPRSANANDAITFVVTPSEPLREPPAITPSASELSVTFREQVEGQFFYDVAGEPGVNLDGYTLTVEAFDRAGNPQRGDSLCEVEDRSGAFLGVAPVLSGDITLTATPSLDEGGTPRAAAGAVVTVVIPTARPISPSRSFVSLSGFDLSSTDGATWTGTLDPTLGDGLKTLTATLVDDAGNTLVVQDPTVAVFADFTPPDVASAVLTRTPFFASADDSSGTVLFTTTDPLTGQAVSASLRVTATEDLGASPILDVHGPALLTWAPGAGAARLATWGLSAIPNGQDGTYIFDVTLEDGLGNRSAPIPLEVVMEIDTVGPANPPNVDAPDRIVLEREPWGTTSVGGTPRYRVVGGLAASPRGVLVSVENAFGAVLGTTTSGGDGSFEIGIGADLADAFVRTYDRAGNPSSTGRVRDVAWTATMAGKVEGSSRENPHRLVSAGVARRPPMSASQTGVEERRAFPIVDSQKPPWQLLDLGHEVAEVPPGRAGSRVAYDAARGVTVLFGGTSMSVSRLSDTWEWNGRSWAEFKPPISPSAREHHALAYDASRGVTVLFGGSTGSQQLASDTWEWDGITWSLRTPTASPSPPSRSSHALVYDASRGVTVLFGGSSAGLCTGGVSEDMRCSDTWEWDGVRWSQRTPTTSPPGREGHALAYDVARGVTVLFGGFDGSGYGDTGFGVEPVAGPCGNLDGGWCSDTWEWDGVTWAQRFPATSPPALSDHTMTYDMVRGVTVLLGGTMQGGNPSSQVWEWDGVTWHDVTPVDNPVADGVPDGLAYDTNRDVMVLVERWGPAVGSCDGSGGNLCMGTWEGDGVTWTRRSPTVSPPARSDHALASDTKRGATLIFGGWGSGSGRCGAVSGWANEKCSDTWEWDGATWTQRAPATSPPAREGNSLAFDATRGVTVLFGGFGTAPGACGTAESPSCSDTWEWDGVSWAQRNPDTSPSARQGHALAYDAARGVTVLLGGGTPFGVCGTWDQPYCSDTWEWDGTTWTEVTPATSTPARGGHALAYDPTRGVTVLFGGHGIGCGTPDSNRCSDTWEWDGTTWTEVTPATSPPARGGHALAYDPTRGVTVLFGGFGDPSCSSDDGVLCSDTWEWNGTTWTEVTPSVSPPGRYGLALAYDAARGATVLFGGGSFFGACGTSGNNRCSDTWLLPSDSTLSPRHAFTPSFAPALAPAATLRAVTARWVAGGSGTPGGDPTEGAELVVWNGLGWTVLDAHAAGPDTAAPLCARLVADPTSPADPGCNDLIDPGLVNRLFRFGPDLTSTFAVRPTAPIGTDEGELRSEDVAVTVRYRLPPE